MKRRTVGDEEIERDLRRVKNLIDGQGEGVEALSREERAEVLAAWVFDLERAAEEIESLSSKSASDLSLPARLREVALEASRALERFDKNPNNLTIEERIYPGEV